ncbi:MAG: major capsid protein [Clostridiaceae bacterium]|nr:major capsid protein [Clostridiaceae bacterium]DAM37301.1 MAG TPA: major capsid protein [Caudoviricetes sp.]
MAFNFYETHTLLMAVQQIIPAASFLRDRYFPTNAQTDVFATTDVLCEYRDGDRKLAPFVAPRKGGVTVLREGSTMKRFTPPFIAPKRSLTIDDLNKRGFGEALYSQLTPEQRQQQLVLRDAAEIGDMITRREEYMAAQIMLTGGCVMKQIADDPTKGDELEVHFYDGASNPYQYTPTVDWDESTATILDDLKAVARIMVAKGLRVADLVCSPDVADAIIGNSVIQSLMDKLHIDIGQISASLIDPDKYPAASIVAQLNIDGRKINVISYGETYEDDGGASTLYIPSGKAVLTAPAAGRIVFGAVSQVEQADGQFHTYTGSRVPKYLASAEGNTRSLTITSCPLPMPNSIGAFYCVNAL